MVPRFIVMKGKDKIEISWRVWIFVVKYKCLINYINWREKWNEKELYVNINNSNVVEDWTDVKSWFPHMSLNKV